jgi:hypothetical protein
MIYSLPIKTLLLMIAICLAAMIMPISALSCTKLPHDKIVTVSGRLIKRIYPGPPNYQSTKLGDAVETPRILLLDNPVCLYPLPDDHLNEVIDNVNETQLILFIGDILNRAQEMSRLHVQVTGSFFSAQSGHHHTPAMFQVESICSDESKQPAYRCAAGN